MQSKTRNRLKLGALALALASLSAPSLAVDYVWKTGGSNNFWDDPNNWSLLGVPGSSDSAQINGTGTGSVLLRDARSLGTLFLNGGTLASTSTLSVGMLDFGSGRFGNTNAPNGGVMNVAGTATFNGSQNQSLDYSHIINLGADTRWTAGDGHLSVATAYTAGSASFPSAQLNIGAGTTFTDAGATTIPSSANNYRLIGGGAVNILGTYRREGIGDTYVRGINVVGTLDIVSGNVLQGGDWRNASSGLIKVASGSTLGIAYMDFTAGQVDNQGLVRQISGTTTVGAGAQINGAWQLDAGRTVMQGYHRIDSLVLNGSQMNVEISLNDGILDVSTLSFNAGKLGTNYVPGGSTLNVQGTASFDGASTQGIDYGHVLNLGGNTTWTAGNGRLSVASAYNTGLPGYIPASVLNIGAGTTFTDAGAATASGYKVIAGGDTNINILGTYRREGLGDTYASGINNSGTLDIASGNFLLSTNDWKNTSSGVIKVASGSTFGLAQMSFTAGQVLNQGLIRQYGGSVVVGPDVQINGAWQLDAGRMTVQGQHRMDSLVNSSLLKVEGVLTVGSLVFNNGAEIGGSYTPGGSVLNVEGPASFDGTSTLDVSYAHVLNLRGNAQWSAGNGRLVVGSAFNTGAPQAVPSAALSIGLGTTFTDAGAASASGTKIIGGGSLVTSFVNDGVYRREGLGTTEAANFYNRGTLYIASGTFSVDERFFSTGQVDIAAGATLHAYRNTLANDGLITGTGTIRTLNSTSTFVNRGSLDPGPVVGLGTLTIDGDLSMADSGLLRIVLGSGGSSDLLAVNGDALWNGTLDLWAVGTELHTGDVFTIATYQQRLAGSTFDSLSWHGNAATQFALEYGADSITLRVTAVPEPGSYALLSLGLLVIGARKWRVQAPSKSIV